MENNQQSLPMKARLMRNIIRYVVMSLFMVVLNYYTSPQVWWSFWVVAGCGLCLLLEIADAFIFHKFKK